MTPPGVTVRHDLRPGDVGNVVLHHGTIYAREHGFDATFKAYVARPLAEFVLQPAGRARLWMPNAMTGSPVASRSSRPVR